MFKTLSIRNFPIALKKKLQLLAIESEVYFSKYIIRILENHVKEKETK